MRDLKEILKKQKAQGKTIFLNSHILSEMELLCDDVAIMLAGEIVETGPVDTVLDAPRHAYTQALIAACPSADSALRGAAQGAATA